MSKEAIFRKVSLDRLASPERLDEVMEVTDARGWVALAAIALLIGVAVGWSIVGVLPEKVTGSGILVRSGGVLEVVANANGRITDIPVAVDEQVQEGQIVAWTAQPDLLEGFQDAKNKLQELSKEHEDTVRFAKEDAGLQRQGLRQQRLNLERSIAADTDRLAALEARIEAQKTLLDKGLIAKPTLLSTQQQFDQTKEKIRASENQLSQIDIQELAIENRLREVINTGELKIAQAERQVEQMQRELNTKSQITSQYSGRILEIMTELGQIVQRGEPILSLDMTGNTILDLVAVIYVPAVHGKKVKPGMTIHIAPTTVRREEYGMLVGRVTFVSSFPATPKGMLRVLKNQQLLAALSGGGSPYEIHAELAVDPSTVSQYKWTSSSGPATRIQSGTVATGYVTVSTQRPISRLLPILRKWALGS